MLERLVKAGLRQGMRRGVRDGNRVWLAVGTLALGARMLQRLARANPNVVSEELRPGETMVIAHLAEPS